MNVGTCIPVWLKNVSHGHLLLCGPPLMKPFAKNTSDLDCRIEQTVQSVKSK